MTLCCPHPDRVHELGICQVLHCGCEQNITLRRCACPYQDCWVLVDTASGMCPTCEHVCAAAKELEGRYRCS